MSTPARLVLASASPRRRELLAQLGVPFDVCVSPLPEPEHMPAGSTPRRWVISLAMFKACAIRAAESEAWLLGADTIVCCADTILNKAASADDARRMLQLQAGRETRVITGVALLGPPVSHAHAARRFTAVGETRVFMRDDPELIEAYVRSGDWVGKAGAYGIQSGGDRLIERIEGSFSNVVGLPLALTARLLRAAGFTPLAASD